MVWEFWFGNCGLRTLAWELWFENFGLGTLVWELWFGTLVWGSEAGGTGLLRLGEPSGGILGEPGRAVVSTGSLRYRVRTL